MFANYVKQNEGFRGQPYDDATGKKLIAPIGKVTIGYGINTDDSPLTEEEATLILELRLKKLTEQLKKELVFFSALSQNRQIALTDMAYNMGIGGLLSFKNTLKLMQQGNFEQAANNVLVSNYAKQVPSRAKRNADLIKKG